MRKNKQEVKKEERDREEEEDRCGEISRYEWEETVK